ncbi:MAG: hypothetical protein CMB96_00250 [Flavobacteriaceae bacterium]|nr:hypothetical protein [Flavobacteriaceae bacterium]|tara:strand:- start:240 stop:476 length:237 start_codon:yes stop_codon:yes gene_type:complete
MNSFEQTFLSPYSQDYCAFYFYLTIIALIFLAMAVVDTIVGLYKNKLSIFDALMSILGPFLIYFTNRLLYSMCMGALN